MATSHLVVTFCTTAGKNGEDLGVDEEQVVLFVYLLFDVLNCKVRGKLLSNFSPRNPHLVNTHSWPSGFHSVTCVPRACGFVYILLSNF